jgi:hypothetical protein
MACRNAVKILTDAEVEAKCPLHLRRLLASDGQAESGGDGMDDVFEGMVIVDGRQQRGTGEKSGLRFTECHVDVVDDVLLEETEDVLRGLERDVAGGGVFLDSDPNGDATGNRICAAVRIRLVPTKADEVDGGEQDLSLVEEFANLRTNVSPQNATLLEDHEPCHEQWPTGCPCPVGRGPRLEEAV